MRLATCRGNPRTHRYRGVERVDRCEVARTMTAWPACCTFRSWLY